MLVWPVSQKCPSGQKRVERVWVGKPEKSSPVGQTESPIARDGCRKHQTGSPCEDKGILLQTQSITVSFIFCCNNGISQTGRVTKFPMACSLQGGKPGSIVPALSEDLCAESHTACLGQRGLGKLDWLGYQPILWWPTPSGEITISPPVRLMLPDHSCSDKSRYLSTVQHWELTF